MYWNWKSEHCVINGLIFCSNSTWARILQQIYVFIKSKIWICGWYLYIDDTTNWCWMFKNQLDLLLDKFEVCSKATTKKSIHELTLFLHTACSMQTHLWQEVTVWKSILWKTKTDTVHNKAPAHPHTQSEDLNIHARSKSSLFSLKGKKSSLSYSLVHHFSTEWGISI